MRRIIVTADDFGVAHEVNDAVERAHREGVLTAVSLMVGAPEAADAVARARRLPSLRLGLHLLFLVQLAGSALNETVPNEPLVVQRPQRRRRIRFWMDMDRTP